MRVQLGWTAQDVPQEKLRQMTEWDAPELPGLSGDAVRRWRGMTTWAPPACEVLARHRRLDGLHWIITNSRQPPAGYLLEYDLGTVHVHAQPGTVRLVADGDAYGTTEEQDELTDGRRALGFVEAHPLPMLDPLELRRVRATGQVLLVGGADDPLRDASDPVAHVGWIEGFPILPRRPEDHSGLWGVRPLFRVPLPSAWRHAYATAPEAAQRPAGGIGLGCVVTRRCEGFVELRRDAHGRLGTELAPAPSGLPRPDAVARWVVAPLGWHGGRPRGWALRAAAGRARRLARLARAPRTAAAAATAAGGGEASLGWLRREERPGWTPLFSAVHPALGDQLVTRSELEAHDLGFRVLGVLGWAFDAHADDSAALQPEVLWGSRFGHGRRTLLGPAAR